MKVKKVSVKDRIIEYFKANGGWLSTRELRQKFGEAADRRLRDLRAEGYNVLRRRAVSVSGNYLNTWFWKIVF